MPTEPESETPNALLLGQAAAVQLGATEWLEEAEPIIDLVEAPPEPEPPTAPLPALAGPLQPPANDKPPPGPIPILESLLFVGGEPLTPEKARAVIRGLAPDQFRDFMETLARKYRKQNRPYAVVPEGDGYKLALKPAFQFLKTKLEGNPREVKLGPAALDVLSLVAYRQPIEKAELDALSGTDAGGSLRQLVRLGIAAVETRATDSQAAAYGTTAKFLEMFGLASLDDLPRLGDSD